MSKVKTIRTEEEYQRYLTRVGELMDAQWDTPEGRELERLSELVEAYEDEHYPIPLPDPVEAIKYAMSEQDLSRKDMEQYLGSASRVSEVLNHKRGLSKTMIRKLNEGLGISLEILTQESGGPEVYPARYAASDYPFKEMFRRGYFGTSAKTLSEARVFSQELLAGLFDRLHFAPAEPMLCKHTDKPVDQNALAAWRAQALALAEAEAIPEFDLARLTDSFCRELIKLSALDDGPARVRGKLNEIGVHLIILPHLPKTYLDGACLQARDGSPVVVLTLRYDRLDNFWFTLAHELGHAALHLDREGMTSFFDETRGVGRDIKRSEVEMEANAFACDVLIAPVVWGASARNRMTREQILDFANVYGISPAIVAGRLQWENGNYRLHSGLIGRNVVRSQFPEYLPRSDKRERAA